MFTSMIYVTGIREAVRLYKGPKYVYYYDHKNKETFGTVYSDNVIEMGNYDDSSLFWFYINFPHFYVMKFSSGVMHGDELISQYNWSSEIKPITEGVDLVVSEQIINLWTNFAATG